MDGGRGQGLGASSSDSCGDAVDTEAPGVDHARDLRQAHLASLHRSFVVPHVELLFDFHDPEGARDNRGPVLDLGRTAACEVVAQQKDSRYVRLVDQGPIGGSADVD